MTRLTFQKKTYDIKRAKLGRSFSRKKDHYVEHTFIKLKVDKNQRNTGKICLISKSVIELSGV